MENIEDEEGGWEIVVATGGRALHLTLPSDLREDQRGYITDHLPRSAKLQRSSIRAAVGATEANINDTRLDTFKTLTEQVCEKRLELFELTRKVSTLKEEHQRLEFTLEQRRKSARSLASAFEELASAFSTKKGK